jgi:hypothetical protein
MDGDEFDTDLFSDEIETRPAIWDMASSDYSNKLSKKRAWEEFVLIFSDSGDAEEEEKRKYWVSIFIFIYLFFKKITQR